MDRSEVARPIIITLDGPNYIPWSQAMSSFSREENFGVMLLVILRHRLRVQLRRLLSSLFDWREWDSKNHQIITWIRNTSIPSISLQFGRFKHCPYHLGFSSHQDPGQSISAFLPQIYSIWDQLTPSEPKWLCAGDSTLFATYRDQQRLILFLMGLSDIYEPVRASLLHRIPLPTLEQAISELLSEETRLGLISSSHVDTALAAPPLGIMSAPFVTPLIIACLPALFGFASIVARKALVIISLIVPTILPADITRPQSTAATVEVSSSASTPPTLIDVSDLPALVQQILSASGNPSTALSASSDVDVPTALLDGASHDVSPPLVYPVESPSTDPAPSVAPPTHLPSDLPVCRSTRLRILESERESRGLCGWIERRLEREWVGRERLDL
ncbi:hypothetical protein Acr_15g0017470 [Actinidia rufa]|uniref:Uncharacterized protein n=1 Tax=Actinidia rufa TaxID=165716 RepID=A0A7J0FWR9_9ERIC|nr:hypothetical protein Acr_15g0017470 [Actinidia rufa]